MINDCASAILKREKEQRLMQVIILKLFNQLLNETDMKLYHIQLMPNGIWITQLGHSLTEIMAHVATFDAMPCAWFTTPTDIKHPY